MIVKDLEYIAKTHVHININVDIKQSKEYLAKEVNHYIFQKNWEGKELSLIDFKNRILAQEEYEEVLAYETKNTFDFHVKWEHLKQLLQ